MNKNRILTTVIIALVALGITMIYLGGYHTPNVITPPILSGIGFVLIAWALYALKDRK